MATEDPEAYEVFVASLQDGSYVQEEPRPNE